MPVAALGLDLGTSALKAVLVGRDGEVVATRREPLSLSSPEEGAAEQDARAWWEAARRAVRALLAGAQGVRVEAIGVTGQKHALLLLDRRGEPLAPAWLWADGRAAQEAEEMAGQAPREAARSGALALPGYVAPKWRCFARRHPDLAARASSLCFAKDWLTYRLTGERVTDPTEASATLCYDPRRRTWDPERARALGLPLGVLPPVRPSHALAGRLRPEVARDLGLDDALPVVVGAGDNEAGALEVGVVDSNVAAVVLGTSGTVMGLVPRRRVPRGLVVGEYVLRRGALATGVVLSAGRSLEWVVETFFPSGTSVEHVARLAAETPPGSAPLFLPTLVGERSPVPDPRARAAFAGIGAATERAHLARAAFEGVALALGRTLDLLRRSGAPASEVRVTGGGARSDFLRGLLAAAAGAPVRRAGTEEGPARGAAALAWAREGGERSVEEIARRWASPGPLETPSTAEVARMRDLGASWEELRVALARARA